MKRERRKRAVSIVELIIAIVILGLLAAIAIPRFSRAAHNSVEDELRHRLSILRTAIELYRNHHDGYPGLVDGAPAEDPAATFVAQLTGRTSADGRPCNALDAQGFGPYLRDGLPCSPMRNCGGFGRVFIWTNTGSLQARAEIEADWLFDCRTGDLILNDPGKDAEGKRFDQY